MSAAAIIVVLCCSFCVNGAQARDRAEETTISHLKGKLISKNFTIEDYMTSVNIVNSTITEIEDGVLCWNGIPEKLAIRFSQLPQITKNWFGDQCPSLKEFELNGNTGTTFQDDDALQPLTGLEVLDIHLQRIDSLNKNLLKLKSLKVLEVKQSTINKIEPDAFVNLPNLEQLNLRDIENKIDLSQTLFNGLTKLKYLNLDGSDLGKLTWEDVETLDSLETLSIAKCNIDEFDTDKIVQLFPKLEVINISDNFQTCDELNKVANDLKAKIKNLTVHVLSSGKEGIPCNK